MSVIRMGPGRPTQVDHQSSLAPYEAAVTIDGSVHTRKPLCWFRHLRFVGSGNPARFSSVAMADLMSIAEGTAEMAGPTRQLSSPPNRMWSVKKDSSPAGKIDLMKLAEGVDSAEKEKSGLARTSSLNKSCTPCRD